MGRHVTYGQYLAAVAATLARRHKPAWSWIRWRYICRCGNELPCRQRHKIPINRGHWPGEASDRAQPELGFGRRHRAPFPRLADVINSRAGMIVHLTRAASPQFLRPIFFRLIRVHTDWITYDGWIWLHGYQLDDRGEAVAQRSVFVQPAGLIVVTTPFPAGRPGRPRPAAHVR